MHVLYASFLNLRCHKRVTSSRCLQALKDDVARGKDAAAGQKRVVYQLQLLGCTFRRALRKSGKRIIAPLSGASSDSSPSEEDERCAAAAICDLLEATDAALLTVQKVLGRPVTVGPLSTMV